MGESSVPGQSGTVEALDRDLLAAHASDDRLRLVDLYDKAARWRFSSGDIDGGCFYLTQAYVFALDTGHGKAEALRRELARHGREPE